MKRKSLLIFLLTAVSATTVVAAAGCAKKHQHTYTWQSDAAMHRSECECGDKKDEGAHIDVLNNATSAEGADGKCDVCAKLYLIYKLLHIKYHIAFTKSRCPQLFFNKKDG